MVTRTDEQGRITEFRVVMNELRSDDNGDKRHRLDYVITYTSDNTAKVEVRENSFINFRRNAIYTKSDFINLRKNGDDWTKA